MGAIRLILRLLGYVRCLVPWCAVLVVTGLLCGQVLMHHVPGHSILPVVATLCHAVPMATAGDIGANSGSCYRDSSGALFFVMSDTGGRLIPPLEGLDPGTPVPTITPMPGVAAMPTAAPDYYPH